MATGCRLARSRSTHCAATCRIDYDVTVPTRTKIRTRTGSGNQQIGEVLGPVDATAGSGDLRVGPIGSSVTLRTGSGDIEVLGARGDVAARTGSGDVQAMALNGSVHVHTASGDITLDGRPGADWTIAAASGNVTLHVPDDAALRPRRDHRIGKAAQPPRSRLAPVIVATAPAGRGARRRAAARGDDRVRLDSC